MLPRDPPLPAACPQRPRQTAKQRIDKPDRTALMTMLVLFQRHLKSDIMGHGCFPLPANRSVPANWQGVGSQPDGAPLPGEGQQPKLLLPNRSPVTGDFHSRFHRPLRGRDAFIPKRAEHGTIVFGAPPGLGACPEHSCPCATCAHLRAIGEYRTRTSLWLEGPARVLVDPGPGP